MSVSYDTLLPEARKVENDCKVTRMLVSYDFNSALVRIVLKLLGRQNVSELRPNLSNLILSLRYCRVTRMLVNYAFLFSSFFIARTNVLIIIYVK